MNALANANANGNANANANANADANGNHPLMGWGIQARRMGGIAAKGILASAITTLVSSHAEALGLPAFLCTALGAGVAAGGLHVASQELVGRAGQLYSDLALMGTAAAIKGFTFVASTQVGRGLATPLQALIVDWALQLCAFRP